MWQQLFGWVSRLISKLFSRQNSDDTSDTPLSAPDLSPVLSDNASWISPEKFRKATGLSAVRAQDWYEHVKAACLAYEITTPARIAAFLAQVGHESGSFVYTREIWGPTAAQQRYEGRADLGNIYPGDGARFRGRGLIQVTGRANYAKASAALGLDLIAHPELLEEKPMAARSAAWWWDAHGCNEIADSGDLLRLTKRINGGTNGLEDRKQRWEIAKQALGI